MHPALARYVESVREICSGGFSLPAKVERVGAHAAPFALAMELSAEQRFIPEQGYGRNLIYRDPDHGFVVIAMVWPPGTTGCPHDHSTWGVVAVQEGTVRIENYRREDDGRDPAKARIRRTSCLDAVRGQLGQVLPPHEDIHSISNPGIEVAVSLHTYGRDIRRCRVFDERTGAVTHADLGYHTGDRSGA